MFLLCLYWIISALCVCALLNVAYLLDSSTSPSIFSLPSLWLIILASCVCVARGGEETCHSLMLYVQMQKQDYVLTPQLLHYQKIEGRHYDHLRCRRSICTIAKATDPIRTCIKKREQKHNSATGQTKWAKYNLQQATGQLYWAQKEERLELLPCQQGDQGRNPLQN